MSEKELEQAIITGLVNAGFDFKRVLNIFRKFPATGKYREMLVENPDRADEWLLHSFTKAVRFTVESDSPGRRAAMQAYKWGISRPWKGKTGNYDRAIYIAHTKISMKACRVEGYAASSRTLAELAGCSHVAAANGTKRLIELGFLTRAEESIAGLASKYTLNMDVVSSGSNEGQTFTLPINTPVRKCKDMTIHDVFRWSGLGKTPKLIWEVLSISPMTVDRLTEVTGRTKRTIKRNLEKIRGIIDSLTGEIIDMVEWDGELWSKKDVDLDQIAKILGTYGDGRKQISRHLREREEHRKALLLGRINQEKPDKT